MNRKPTPPRALVDAPAEGPSVAFVVSLTFEGETHEGVSCALLGPGRDYLTHEDAVAAAINNDHVTTTVSKQYETISELVTDYPNAHLDGTARRMLAVERQADEYRQEVAAWEARLAAAGLQPCDKCGGAGGWKGWPGFTCYDCGGTGTQEIAA